jgi:hypothetical protein
MSNRLKMLAIAAAVAATTSGTAMAQVCPAGYSWYAGACQPAATAYAPGNPVSGAAVGGATGAAAGAAAAGPVGAVVGGAVGTAAGAVGGAANMATGAPVVAYGSSVPPAPAVVCGPGLVFYGERCYPAH